MTNRDYKFHFPARDKLLEKSNKTIEGITEIQKEFNELKNEFMKFQWYEKVIELKEIQSELESIKTKYQDLDAKLFKLNTPKQE